MPNQETALRTQQEDRMGSVPWWLNAIAGVVSMATAVNFFAMAYGCYGND
jgi:hypothetical protein